MSIAISPDRKEESTENITGAPDVAAQQLREHQAASHPSSSSTQQHAGTTHEQHHLTELHKTSNQQHVGEQHLTKS